MIVTDGFIKALVEADAVDSGMVFGLCTGQMPTLESLRRDHAVVDRIYFQGPTEPTLRNIVPKLGGDIVTRTYWATARPIAREGKIVFPFAANAPAQRGFVFKDAVPTWAFCIWNRAAVTNSVAIWLPTPASAHAACFNIALMSVGDEHSNADIKIVGGKLFAGSIFNPANFEASYSGTNVLS